MEEGEAKRKIMFFLRSHTGFSSTSGVLGEKEGKRSEAESATMVVGIPTKLEV